MAIVGMAGLPSGGYRIAAPHGRGADLCAPLRPFHAGRHSRRGRPRRAGLERRREDRRAANDEPEFRGRGPITISPNNVAQAAVAPVAFSGGGERARGDSKGGKGRPTPPVRILLDADASAQLRDRLASEVASLSSADAAAEWVHRTLPLKNTLMIADARSLEHIFKERISALESTQTEEIDAPKPGLANTPFIENVAVQSDADDSATVAPISRSVKSLYRRLIFRGR